MIGFSLSNVHLSNFHGMEMSNQMWNAILYTLEKHTLMNRLSAQCKLHTANMSDGETILAYSNMVRNIGTTMETMGGVIYKGELASTAHHGLPVAHLSPYQRHACRGRPRK